MAGSHQMTRSHEAPSLEHLDWMCPALPGYIMRRQTSIPRHLESTCMSYLLQALLDGAQCLSPSMRDSLDFDGSGLFMLQ